MTQKEGETNGFFNFRHLDLRDGGGGNQHLRDTLRVPRLSIFTAIRK